MEALTVHPKNREQLQAIKAVLQAMKIPFNESKESPYSPEFVNMINESEQQIKEGKCTRVKSVDELNAFLAGL